MTATIETAESNKRLVLKAYELFAAHDLDAVGELLTETFVTHNPNFPQGRRPFIEAVKASPLARATFEIQQVVAEGELVVVRHVTTLPGAERPTAVADFWRVEGSLAAEHWDVVQP
jgi:predicted SnoaL-like aldol condensation-catalyzing enzyme